MLKRCPCEYCRTSWIKSEKWGIKCSSQNMTMAPKWPGLDVNKLFHPILVETFWQISQYVIYIIWIKPITDNNTVLRIHTSRIITSEKSLLPKKKYKKQGIFNRIYIELGQIILRNIFLKCMHCWLKLTKEIWKLQMLLKRCPCEYLNFLDQKWKNGESSVHPDIWLWHLNDLA